MGAFDTLNQDPRVLAMLFDIRGGRGGVRGASGNGVSGPDARTHHVGPVVVVYQTQNHVPLGLNDTLAARALLLMNEQVGEQYGINAAQNPVIAPTVQTISAIRL